MGPILGGVPRVKYTTEKTFIQCEGNSLTIGVGVPYQSGLDYPSVLQSIPPISGGLTIRNGGASGQTTAQMIATSGPNFADSFYKSGKTNVLIVWEGTNSISQTGETGGRTAQQALDEMEQYCHDRLAAHPDFKIILLTTLPRMGGFWGTAVGNQHLQDYNDGIMSSYRDFGAKMVIDVRQAGSPFAFSGYSNEDFNAPSVAPYWMEGETTHIHLSAAGYAVVANMVAQGLRRLRLR